MPRTPERVPDTLFSRVPPTPYSEPPQLYVGVGVGEATGGEVGVGVGVNVGGAGTVGVGVGVMVGVRVGVGVGNTNVAYTVHTPSKVNSRVNSPNKAETPLKSARHCAFPPAAKDRELLLVVGEE